MRKPIGAHLNFDARKWRGVEWLAQRMEAEGFLLPALRAQLASDLCDGEFLPEEFEAESTAAVYAWIAWLYERTGEGHYVYPDRCHSLLKTVWRGMSLEERRQRYWKPIEQQQRIELRLLPPEYDELVLKKSEVRKFANKLAKASGFRRAKSKLAPFPSSVERILPRSGLYACMSMDAGGSQDQIPRGFELWFMLADSPEADVGCNFAPTKILHGMGDYEQPYHGVEYYGPEYREFLTYPKEHWSDMQKLGVYSQFRCFELFLESFDAAMSTNTG